MPLEMHAGQTQYLTLTKTMLQSLHCLELSSLELRDCLLEAATSNPLLELDDSWYDALSLDIIDVEAENSWEDFTVGHCKQQILDNDSTYDILSALLSKPASFSDYLNEQLGQIQNLDRDTLARCRYLVGCLNSAGYLDCSLSEHADETGQSLFDMEQALFVVQSLDPLGTAARNLSECLLLQLAQSSDFNELNIHMIRFGLPLLAKNDYKALSKVLRVPKSEVIRSAEIIRSLNPIPSRGFCSSGPISYTVPEAYIHTENGRIVVEMNSRILSSVSISREYVDMLNTPLPKDTNSYLREKQREAQNILYFVKNRSETLYQILTAIIEIQQAFFKEGKPLKTMTMHQMADKLNLNVSTISRAVKGKYIVFNQRAIPLRSFFTHSVSGDCNSEVSVSTLQQTLRKFISAENPTAPLSDEALHQALAGVSIHISRRTVTKYRMQMGIPSAQERRRIFLAEK